MRKLLELREIQVKLKEVESYLENYLHFDHQLVSASALYTLQAGGKRLRPAFVLMPAMFFNHESHVIPLAAAMELIHMASLIHDDVIDDSDQRRGQATVNVASGNRYALHTGNYVLTEALHLVKQVQNNEAILKILAQLSIEMCQGEIQQLVSMFDTNQTIEDYDYRINRKTALLIATCCQVGAMASNASLEMVQVFYDFGYHLGMAFQIKDDILDMEENKNLGKPAGSDLAHGIITLPTILVLQKDFPEKQHLTDLIKNRFPNGESDVKEAIALIRRYGGLEDAKKHANLYIQKAKALVHTLPEHPVKKNMISGADYMMERVY